MNNKRILFLFVFICIIIFSIFYYIFFKFGNNNTRNQKELLESKLEKLEHYEANVDVIIKSNKTENKYNMDQIVLSNYSKLKINLPEEISDLVFEINNNILKISRNSLDLSKCYDEYKVLNNNSLFLKSFIEDYKKCTKSITMTDDMVIIKLTISNNPNTYIKNKTLYLEQDTYLPIKLIIEDDSQNIYTSIIYNDIKIK